MNLGKKVKVRDMNPGWTYTMPDKTIEELCKESYSWPPLGMDKVIPNTGFLLYKPKPEKDGTCQFNLYLMQELNELADKALRPGQSGTCQIVRTGNKIWSYHPNYSVHIEVDSMDFEMEEAHPFPVASVRENGEIIPLPNPWTWHTVSSDTPSRSSNYVQVWDESDMKTLMVLGLISVVLLMAGISGISIMIMMWLVAMAYFHSKHEKIRKDILEERDKHGIRGSGLDHKFRW